MNMGKLESDVEHLKTDVADIKIDVRRLNDKVDGIIASVSALHVELKDLISSRTTWAIWLYVGLTGLLLSMARGFKWL